MRKEGVLFPFRLKNIIFLCFFLLSILFLFSCASGVKYYPQVNADILNQDYDSAYRLIKENKNAFKKRNILLYYLDKGIIAHFASRFEESNQCFSMAESIMERLYTKSISREASSFIINDNTIPYEGEDFEKVLINLFMAINYVELGRLDDALVEARKVDNKLNVLNSRYEDDKKNVYREDPFVRFLMGVIYEDVGEINDAFISYRMADTIYRTDYLPNYGVSSPRFLLEKLICSAKAMGFDEELNEAVREHPAATLSEPLCKKDMAEIYFIHYNGLGPEKIERFLLIPIPDGYIAKIAYPAFQKRRYRIVNSRISLTNLKTGRIYTSATVLMEDIASIAVLNLKNRISRIIVKATARATIKYLVARKARKIAEKEGGDLLALFVHAFAQAAIWVTEKADLRQWRLLPAEIRLGRNPVPAGRYRGEIRFTDAGGTIISSRHLPDFTVKKGEKKFFMYRTIE